MEVSLRDIKRVNSKSIIYTLKHWRSVFSVFEKTAVSIILIVLLLTSWKWAQAASKDAVLAPSYGGVYIEGVVADSLDGVDLGRLTKSALVQLDSTGKIIPDLASSWEVSEDKSSYNFSLNSRISAAEVADTISKNPTYIPGGSVEIAEAQKVNFKLQMADANFLNSLTRPIFPYGPYKIDKKTNDEIRLKRNSDYHLGKAYIDKFIIRKYPDQNALDKAAQKGAVTGATNLGQIPQNWQTKTITLNKKHILYINSLKSYLKSTKSREQILSGQKPDGVQTLDVLEVNGANVDGDYDGLKQKLTQAGIELKVRKITLKDALKDDLPKRNYDILYILVSENLSKDPYLNWNSTQRSGDGQNFAEVANASLDKLTQDYRDTEDQAQKDEIMKKVNEIVAKEKVAIEYKNIEIKYTVSPKVKGVSLSSSYFCETDRFDLASTWYVKEKKAKK